jgi:two-component system, OmpR family, osmolarity sensor histidine kinase EnvZ
VRLGRPQTLFGQTALLTIASLSIFSVIAWAAIVWTAIIPAALASGHAVAEKVTAAADAVLNNQPLAPDVTIEPNLPAGASREVQRVYFSFYLSNFQRQLLAELPGAQIYIPRSVMPLEIWIRLPRLPGRWIVLTLRLARPGTPVALTAVVAFSAMLVLVGAGIFARRLTAPLADLARATSRISEGEPVALNTGSGPSEVRELATAFSSMSARLVEHEERREIMLAGLSHDLRSPLARLRVAIELLDGRDAALAEQMTAEIEDIDRMVGQFLHYVRAGYREPPIEASADDVIRETLAHYADSDSLRLELAASEPRLIAVESIQHMLYNLVSNALEHGRRPVTVQTSLTAKELKITVADHGSGLTPEEWEAALQPFHRIRATPGDGHTGLGLALVQRLVQAYRGTLKSRRTPDGFLVEVILPA